MKKILLGFTGLVVVLFTPLLMATASISANCPAPSPSVIKSTVAENYRCSLPRHSSLSCYYIYSTANSQFYTYEVVYGKGPPKFTSYTYVAIPALTPPSNNTPLCFYNKSVYTLTYHPPGKGYTCKLEGGVSKLLCQKSRLRCYIVCTQSK